MWVQSLVLLQFEYIRGSVFYQDLFKGYRYKSSKVYKGIWIHSFIFSLIHPANHQKWREKKGCGVSNDFYQIQNIKIIKIKKCVGVFIFSRSNCSPAHKWGNNNKMPVSVKHYSSHITLCICNNPQCSQIGTKD